MLSNFSLEACQNSGDKVPDAQPDDAIALFDRFLAVHDFTVNTRRAFTQDFVSFKNWFTAANHELLVVTRVTVRDIADFKTSMRVERGQAVATVNRRLVTLRRFFGWLASEAILPSNPAKPVKEFRRQALAPRALGRPAVRRLLREVEVRDDIRARAIFTLMLFTGARVGDVARLEVHDLVIGERSGSAVFRFGKGNKQRTVPLSLEVRKALQDYLRVRPPAGSDRVFVGERGPLTERGIRALCDKYSAMTGIEFSPHRLRHTMATTYLEQSSNDLVGLAQLLGHENLSTTSRYTRRTEEALAEAADRMRY